MTKSTLHAQRAITLSCYASKDPLLLATTLQQVRKNCFCDNLHHGNNLEATLKKKFCDLGKNCKIWIFPQIRGPPHCIKDHNAFSSFLYMPIVQCDGPVSNIGQATISKSHFFSCCGFDSFVGGKKNVNVNVYAYSLISHRVQQTSQFISLILELSLVRSHLLWGEFSTFSAAIAIHNSPLFVPPGTHHCWVDRGGMIWKTCPTPLHTAGSMTRASVTHPSTNRARRCLTSVIWWELVTTWPCATVERGRGAYIASSFWLDDQSDAWLQIYIKMLAKNRNFIHLFYLACQQTSFMTCSGYLWHHKNIVI